MSIAGAGTGYMTLALYLPVLGQIVMGAILAGAGILTLVLGHRKYDRHNKK